VTCAESRDLSTQSHGINTASLAVALHHVPSLLGLRVICNDHRPHILKIIALHNITGGLGIEQDKIIA
jgi:hypothetical protein